MQLGYFGKRSVLMMMLAVIWFLTGPGIVSATMYSLNVISSPQGAAVYIDNDYQGTTPLEIRLVSGGYYLTVVMKGYPLYKEKLNLMHGNVLRKINFNQMASQRLGNVQISSTPAQARIYVNGGFSQETPADFELEPGYYNFRIEKHGFIPYQQSVNVQAGRTAVLNPRLEPEILYGSVQIRSYPEGARIFINDRYIDVSPAVARLPAGTYQIKVEKDRFIPETRQITVPQNRTVNIEFRLRPEVISAKVDVQSRPSGAKIFLDNRFYAVSPAEILIPTGMHTLRIEKKGYKTEEDTFNIRGGEILKRNYHLYKGVNIEQPPRAILRVYSDPEGASVKVRNRFRGKTPLDIELLAGTTHTVLLSALNYWDKELKVRLKEGEIKELVVYLDLVKQIEPLSTLNLTCNVDAKVIIDGQFRGTAPLSVRLEPGKHRVQLIKKGFNTIDQEVKIELGKDERIKFQMNKEAPARVTGQVKIISRPLTAKVFIGNRYYGETPLTVTLEPGLYPLKIQYRGYETFQQHIRVYPGDNKAVMASLEDVNKVDN